LFFVVSPARRAFDAFAESTTAVMLIIIASVVWAISPLIALLFLLAVVDAVDDVNVVVNGKSIYPIKLWKVLNVLFEVTSFIAAFMLLELAITYAVAFPVPFWYAAFAIGGIMAYSSIRDLGAYVSVKKSVRGGYV